MTDVRRNNIIKLKNKIKNIKKKKKKRVSHTRARAERLGLGRLVLSRPVTAILYEMFLV